jgi:hypothetical protein
MIKLEARILNGMEWLPTTELPLHIDGERLIVERPDIEEVRASSLSAKSNPVFTRQLLGSAPPPSQLSLPLREGTYFCLCQSSTYRIEIRDEVSAPEQNRLKSWGGKIFLASLAFHLLFFAALYLNDLLRFRGEASGAEVAPNAQSAAEEESAPQAQAAPLAQRHSRPFQGRSLWFHLKNKRDNSEDGVMDLLSDSLAEDSATAAVPRSAGAVKGGGLFALSGAGLAAPRAEIAAPAPKEDPKKVAEERKRAEAELRQLFAKLEPQVRRLYDRALLKDPSINFHLVLTAKVNAQGSLGNLNFQVSGLEATQTSVFEEFKKELAGLLSQLRVSQVLNGFLVRRELVFWR